MIKKRLDKGTLYITEEVFAIITSIVIEEMEQIVRTVSDLKDEFTRVVYQKGNQRGIRVEQKEGQLSIYMKISVFFGPKITDICKELQKRIQAEIYALTGIEISSVHVKVDSVHFKENLSNEKDAKE